MIVAGNRRPDGDEVPPPRSHHDNLWTLQFSAASAIQLRETGKTQADLQP